MKTFTALTLCFALIVASPSVLSQPGGNKPIKGAHKGASLQNGSANGNAAVKNALPETEMDKLEAQEEKKTIFEDPLQGVIVNRTVTVLGNDFYQYFTSYWNQVNQESRYSIAIYERPTARWGSEIWIEFRQRRIFHTFLAPARAAAKDIAEAAADMVEQNIMRAELIRMTIIEHDLGPEEL